MNEQEYKIKETDYIRYIDNTPFLNYLSLSFIMILVSVFIWPKLLLYTVAPIAMANLVGGQRQDRLLLSVTNFALAFLVSMYSRHNKLF